MRAEWSLAPEQAIRWQQSLQQRLRLEDDFPRPLQRIGGVDTGYRDPFARAVIVVLRYPTLQILHHTVVEVPVSYPYIPGLLTMREGPAIEAAWAALPADLRPQLLFFDGHGIAHPRRMGIAAHMGVLLDVPAIGVAKRVLCGRHAPVPDRVGAWEPLFHRGERVGAVLRTRRGVKPVIVSPGHRVSLDTAVRLTLTTCRGYKLPEPTRRADRLSRQRPR